MRFLIIGDLYGNKPNLYFKDFDAIIAPGDFCSDKLREPMFEALKLNLKNPQNKIKWYDLIGKEEAKKEIEKSIRDGREILKYLNSFNKPVYIVPGNWDWTSQEESEWEELKKNHFEKLIYGLENIINLDKKKS